MWWVELAPINDPDAVAPALLAALGASEDGTRPAIEVALDHLSHATATMVVFDNCEHLTTPIARLVDRPATCPTLTILATSREPLGLAGEVTWRVPSLALPPRDAPNDLAAVTQYDAVSLFLERARRSRPQLPLTDARAAAVAEICHRLDGIPLAIELAAGAMPPTVPERIAAELDDRFRLLTGGARTLLPRQQTLQASVEWSHELLDGDEKTVLRRLGVFAGPFRYEAAEAVASAFGDLDRWAVLDVLGRLVDKSLVQLDDLDDEEAPEPLYRLLETVRQFALDQARHAGELTTLRDAHADWWITELDRLDARQPTEETIALCDRHTADLRAALDWIDADPSRRFRLLALVALAWSWAGRNDEVLAYADRWLLAGPPAGHETEWALAFAPCSMTLYCAGWEALEPHRQSVYELIDAARDGRAAIAGHLALVRGDADRGERIQRALELASESGADSLLVVYGPMLVFLLDAHGPQFSASARRMLYDALERASSPHQLGLALVPFLREHTNVTGLQARTPDTRPWDPSERRFLLDRLGHAIVATMRALRSGESDFVREAAAYIGAFRHLAIGPMWTNLPGDVTQIFAVGVPPPSGWRCCCPLPGRT